MDELEIFTGIFYTHKVDHRNNSPEKSQWIITEAEERECFKCFFESCFDAQERISWGLYFKDDKIDYLGKTAQNEPNFSLLFIAKFIDSTKNQKWHGYPANPGGKKQQDIPHDFILKEWGNKNYLPFAKIRKIERGQKCKL
jgi:hypothetical protein